MLLMKNVFKLQDNQILGNGMTQDLDAGKKNIDEKRKMRKKGI